MPHVGVLILHGPRVAQREREGFGQVHSVALPFRGASRSPRGTDCVLRQRERGSEVNGSTDLEVDGEGHGGVDAWVVGEGMGGERVRGWEGRGGTGSSV